MSIHIIIDGYNLIRQSSLLKEIERIGLEEARDALVDQLCAYKKLRPHPITVVFDGWGGVRLAEHSTVHKGIKCIFSGTGQTADDVIIAMARKEKIRALVVTSDNALASVVQRYGSEVISSPDFEEKLVTAAYMGNSNSIEPMDQGGSAKLTTRKKGPSRRLPKKKRKRKTRLAKI
jgi:uncharacterized protein